MTQQGTTRQGWEAERLLIDEVQATGIIQQAIALYSDHPQEDGRLSIRSDNDADASSLPAQSERKETRPYWIYGSTHRPMNAAGFPLRDAWYVNAWVKVHETHVFTWVILPYQLPDTVIYGYELAICYEPFAVGDLVEVRIEGGQPIEDHDGLSIDVPFIAQGVIALIDQEHIRLDREDPDPIEFHLKPGVTIKKQLLPTQVLMQALAEVDAEGLSDEELEAAAEFYDRLMTESRERNQ